MIAIGTYAEPPTFSGAANALWEGGLEPLLCALKAPVVELRDQRLFITGQAVGHASLSSQKSATVTCRVRVGARNCVQDRARQLCHAGLVKPLIAAADDCPDNFVGSARVERRDRSGARDSCHGARVWQVLLVLLACLTAAHAGTDGPDAWFEATTQALYDALVDGNQRPWNRVLAADCLITTEDGEVVDKATYVARVRPLPRGFAARIKVRGLTVLHAGEAAMVHYWLDETEQIFDQELRTTYVETDTYRRSGDSWVMIAAQETVAPRDLEPVPGVVVDVSALTGEYRFADADTSPYKVFLQNGALFMGHDPRTAKQLIPLAPLVFYVKGSIHIVVFVRGESGAIVEVRELHKYNEVRMRRVPGSH